jgi:hypothetical protein
MVLIIKALARKDPHESTTKTSFTITETVSSNDTNTTPSRTTLLHLQTISMNILTELRVASECLLFGIFVFLPGTVVVGFPTTMDRIFLVVDTFSDVDFPGKLVLRNTAESKVVNGC